MSRLLMAHFWQSHTPRMIIVTEAASNLNDVASW